MVVEQTFLGVMLEARKELPQLEHVIVVDGEAPEGTVPLGEIEGSNPDFDAIAAAAQVKPDDVLTLIYTSGTTGPPKGVQLSHHAIMFGAKSIEEIIVLEPGSRVISWLPSAHIAERNAHHYIPTIYAGSITCAPNPRDILSYLPQVRPQWFFAVPRIWEKLKAGLETMLAGQPEEQRAPVQNALESSIERIRLQQRGEPVPDELEAAWAQADVQVFSNLRAMLGLDQVSRGQRRRGADAGRGARVLPRARDRAVRAVGDVRDVRDRHVNRPGTSRSEPSGRRRRASS